MIEGKKLWKELLSVEDQPSKPVLTQTCTGVFFIRAVSDTISVTLFFFRTRLRTTWPTSADHSLRNTDIAYRPAAVISFNEIDSSAFF
jgi:hypothetical protein